MTAYWRGLLEQPPHELLQEFFNRAPLFVRQRAIEYVGRGLSNDSGPVNPNIWIRLESLWESRLRHAKLATNSQEAGMELSESGWWLTAPAIDAVWGLTQLLEVLQLGIEVNPDFLIMKFLAEKAELHSTPVAEIADLLVRNSKDAWFPWHWKNEINTIAGHVTESGQREALASMERCLNRLGRKGFLEYRDSWELVRGALKTAR
jgi:hypothetical protein